MIVNGTNIAMLTQGYRANFQTGFSGYTPMWSQLATLVPSTTSEEIYPWLGMNNQFMEWLGDRQVQNLKQYDWRVKNRTFEMTVGVEREKIEDDQYGIYKPMMETLGYEAAAHPDSLVFSLLPSGLTTACYDGQYFFDTDHPVGSGTVSNYGGGSGTPWYILDTTRPIKPLVFQKRRDYKFEALIDAQSPNVWLRKEYLFGCDARVNASYGLWQFAYASKQPLTDTNVAAAIAAMRSVKGDNGRPMNVNPNLLVVPPSMEFDADKVVTAVYGSSGASNVMAGKLKVLTNAYLA